MTPITDESLRAAVDRAKQARPLGGPDAAFLVDLAQRDIPQLMAAGWEVRRHFFGRAVRMCSIVPGKLGGCSEDCAWCAQSHAADTDTGAKAHRTPCSEILAAGVTARQGGAAGRLGIVNSGRGPTDADLAAVLDALSDLRTEMGDDLHLCASLGAITEDQARRLAEAGIDRYHHNLETSRRLFGELVTTHTYDERLATLAAVKRAGLDVCCGGLFGLGETWADRIDLAVTIRDDVGPVSVPLNFLNAIPGTALADQTPLTPEECLATIAIFRLLLPTADIKVAGGRERCLGDRQGDIFHAGATSCMTGDYLTTCGQGTGHDLAMVAEMGFEVVKELPKIA